MKAFGIIFRECYEKYAKSITFIDKSCHRFCVFLKNAENLIKPMENVLFQIVKNCCKIPYKTCRLWRLLGPFWENGPKKEPKSITFIDKTDIGFRQVGKPYKTNGKLMILRAPFRQKCSFWHPSWCKSHRVQKGDQTEVWKTF